MITYKNELTKVMTDISKDTNVIFLGYNVKYGHQFYGTLKDVRPNKLLEMPVAENLIMGVAMGMSLEGARPIVCLERMDFLWACADAIVNHLDKVEKLGWPPLRVIIRTCVGSTTPLDPGIQHSGDYVDTFHKLLHMPVMPIYDTYSIPFVWKEAMKSTGPVIVVEYKSKYNEV